MSLVTKQQRVLIIEDKHDAADMLATHLRIAGHEVHLAQDGPSGMRVAFEVQPSVILCAAAWCGRVRLTHT